MAEKTHIHVFVTKNNKFRAEITEPDKPMYSVTIGGESWYAGKGNEYALEIKRKCDVLISILNSQEHHFKIK